MAAGQVARRWVAASWEPLVKGTLFCASKLCILAQSLTRKVAAIGCPKNSLTAIVNQAHNTN
jgi:hypothetical protein